MIPDQNSTPTIQGSLQIHKHVLVEQFCTYDIISSDSALEETEDTFFFYFVDEENKFCELVTWLESEL